jgi:excisionase family DNA binding protein
MVNMTIEELIHSIQELSEQLALSNSVHSQKIVDAKLDDNKFIGISEAAKILKLSVPTVYGLVHRKRIPTYKPGKILYFLPSDLEAYLKSGRQQTVSEIKTDAARSLNRNRKKCDL